MEYVSGFKKGAMQQIRDSASAAFCFLLWMRGIDAFPFYQLSCFARIILATHSGRQGASHKAT